MAGPPPHGHNIGVWKCIRKVKLQHAGLDQFITVVFTGDKVAGMSIELPKEDADYFVEGQSYSFAATQP